jgi:hypothetical protein
MPVFFAGDEDEREIGVEMEVGVGEAGPVEHHRVVQQRAVAVLRRFQLAHIVGVASWWCRPLI